MDLQPPFALMMIDILGGKHVVNGMDLDVFQNQVGFTYFTKTSTTNFIHTKCSISVKDGACGNLYYKDDGYCDDENNNAGCDWDGGDCCGDNVDTYFCNKCECLDPQYSGMFVYLFAALQLHLKAVNKRKNKFHLNYCNRKSW